METAPCAGGAVPFCTKLGGKKLWKEEENIINNFGEGNFSASRIPSGSWRWRPKRTWFGSFAADPYENPPCVEM